MWLFGCSLSGLGVDDFQYELNTPLLIEVTLFPYVEKDAMKLSDVILGVSIWLPVSALKEQ